MGILKGLAYAALLAIVALVVLGVSVVLESFSLAGALRGIICQRLVPRADGEGRCVAMEVCVNTGRIAEAISDPDKTSTINGLINDGAYYGMQTFDQHLVSLIRDGVITLDAAMSASTNPHDLTVELRRLGLVA